MPYRKIFFANNEIYHVLNRGVAQQPIFLTNSNYQKFLAIIDYYRYNLFLRFSHYSRMTEKEKNNFIKKSDPKPIVDILAFCLMPNHFHLLLKQLQEKGIQIFMRKVQNSYVKYFNLKNNRIGPLFQSPFKAIRIEKDEQLVHISRYIHLNPSSSNLVKIKDLEKYFWFSLPEYLGRREIRFIHPEFILNFFKTKKRYKEFIFDQASYQKELQNIKYLCLEKSV